MILAAVAGPIPGSVSNSSALARFKSILPPVAVLPLALFVSSDDAISEADVVDLDEITAGTAILVVRSGEEEGDYFVLSSAVTTIGRHAESTIVLDDITVSRRHSEIHKTDGRYLVKDAGSLNGTYVNQERVDVAELRQGDELLVGKFHLIFLESADKR